jgi:molybdopterin molybdotransferase
MQVFGIVGWKNNGKTTLVERLIKHLTQMGYKVSSVKHAHHNVDIDEPGRDSYRHRAAGAHQTLLSTDKRWALMHDYEKLATSELSTLLNLFEPCDLVIVEGYKASAHAKIEAVLGPDNHNCLAATMPNVVAVATNQDHLNIDLPQLDINNIVQVADFILQHTGLVNASSTSNDCYSADQQLLPASLVWQRMQQAVATQIGDQQSSLLGTQILALGKCINRRLAQNVTSKYDSPRFDNVAVDGYAFNHDQLSRTKHFTLPLMSKEANAGGSAKISLTRGHCIKVLTGARMPVGCDTVVMQEDVSISQDGVVFPTDCKAGSNWRPQGEDVKTGDVIIAKGQQIRPQDIGLAAAAGQATLEVYHKVKVALFSTGNEVYELGQELPEDGIYDVNRHLLKALLESLHCEVSDLGILADDFDVVKHAISAASQNHQLIITSGGASTGSHDHVALALADIGQVHGWRLAIKPGRPLAFGQVGKALFLGLPGNPVASNVCTLMFGQPLIRAIGGGGWHRPKAYAQPLGFDVKKKVGRREWLRVYQQVQDNGTIVLARSASHGSGILTSMTFADGLVEIDEATGNIPKGTLVNFIPFASFGIGDA